MFKKMIKKLCYMSNVSSPDGKLGVYLQGHQEFVGGNWYDIGRLQYDFLKHEGLQPNHVLLDIGCGSLRGGRYFIEYLNRYNYIGVDKNRTLIKKGLKYELSTITYRVKQPQFIVTKKFNFRTCRKTPNFICAFSVFTHLNIYDIRLCFMQLNKLLPLYNQNIFQSPPVFYASYYEMTDNNIIAFLYRQKYKSHSHRRFEYTFDMLSYIADMYCFKAYKIDNYNHPNQKMIKFVRGI